MSSPRDGNVRRDHDFVFAALETFQRFDPLTLRAIGMQDCDRVLAVFQVNGRRGRR